uniref:(northern house mosquito) hypothetical protein n=1 Tax=Culex pipiens TaxID=7175 RepID=A0A8D8KPA9_CULPI
MVNLGSTLVGFVCCCCCFFWGFSTESSVPLSVSVSLSLSSVVVFESSDRSRLGESSESVDRRSDSPRLPTPPPLLPPLCLLPLANICNGSFGGTLASSSCSWDELSEFELKLLLRRPPPELPVAANIELSAPMDWDLMRCKKYRSDSSSC